MLVGNVVVGGIVVVVVDACVGVGPVVFPIAVVLPFVVVIDVD